MRTVDDFVNTWVHFKNLGHQKSAVKKLAQDILYYVPEENLEEFWLAWSNDTIDNAIVNAAKLPQSGIELIKHFEGFVPYAYKDAIHGWDVPTIGYGTTKYSNGKKVKKGDTIDKIQAEYELKIQCNNEYFPAVMDLPNFKFMSEGQKGAILSFAYNLGAKFYGAKNFNSITWALSSMKNWYRVPEMLYKYRNPGTSAEAGLARRRKSEGHLWATGELKFDF